MVRISRFLSVLVLLAVVLGLVSSISAQGESGGLPPCSDDEMASIAATFLEFGTGFADLGERIQSATEAELPDLTAELNDFQVRWWGEVVPTIPNCSPAADLSLLMGRVVDDSLIALALTQAGYDDLAASHVEQVTALSEELANRVTELSATGPRAGRWEGSGRGFTISFNVSEPGTVTQLDIEFTAPNGDTCATSGGSMSIGDNNAFNVENDSSFSRFNVEGAFVSETVLEGTYTLEGCGPYAVTGRRDVPWTAEWQG